MTRHVGVGREIARATGLPARPDRDGRDFHPGVIAWPGSSSVLAALSDSLDTRGIARETPPTLRLPGNPIPTPGRDLHNGFIPVVSARQTPRCFERGLFFNEGRVIRAQIPFASSVELGGYAARDSAEVLPRVGLHVHSMEISDGNFFGKERA